VVKIEVSSFFIQPRKMIFNYVMKDIWKDLTLCKMPVNLNMAMNAIPFAMQCICMSFAY